MSTTSAPNTPEGTPPAATPKKSRKLLIIIVLFVALAGGGGGGAFYFLRASAASEARPETRRQRRANAAQAERENREQQSAGNSNTNSLADALPDDEGVHQVTELPPFIVNLADREQARYLRLTVSVGVGQGATSNPLFLTRVRNALLAVLVTKASNDVLTNEGKAALRRELLEAAQAASDEPHVEAIYITDLIVQL